MKWFFSLLVSYMGPVVVLCFIFSGFQHRSFQLPFSEKWDYGSFGPNDWQISSNDWIVAQDTGNPAPSALFNPSTQILDYSQYLLSSELDATDLTEGNIYLVYDISLSSVLPSGNESLTIQVWSEDFGEFFDVMEYSNLQGSFEWHRDTLNIKAHSMGQHFKIRFLAEGENSSNINYWGIDNIDVYRECSVPPYTAYTELIDDTCIFHSLNFFPIPGAVSTGCDFAKNIKDDDQRSSLVMVDLRLYFFKDGDLLWMESIMQPPPYPMPNPICVDEDGEYCFYFSAVYEGNTGDFCESPLALIGCESVIINRMSEHPAAFVKVYPNPGKDKLNISCEGPISRIRIYNSTGKMLADIPTLSNHKMIDIHALNDGLYVIEIINKEVAIRRKFIVRH